MNVNADYVLGEARYKEEVTAAILASKLLAA
jgi:hypothetical protein